MAANTIPSDKRLGQLVAAGEELTSSGVPILSVKPRNKVPVPHPSTGSWWIVHDPDDVAGAFRQTVAALGDANIALVAGRAKDSPVLVVDMDGPSGMAKARELDVTSGAKCWVQQTGSGGGHFQVVYFHEVGLELHRHVRA